MLKVDNKGIIQKISTRSLKQNITTNRIVVLAVILMTFMFTTVFTIGISIAQNMNTMLIRQEGNIARTIISHPTDGLIEQVKKCSSLYHAGISVNAGQAKPISGEDFTINLIYNDEENYKYNLKPALSDIHGTYPKKIDEIMMSKNGLNELGIKDPEVGDKISLIINGDKTIFSLSGWFQNYGFRTNNYDSYISKDYSEKLGKTIESNGELYISSRHFMESKLLDEIDQIELNTNQTITASESNDTTIFVAAIVLFLSLVIVVSGYLLIYNIMYISVNHNIRFYGMLKTIGTTSRQIRKIVRTQALRISVYGIPIGILLGVAVSFAGMPFVVKTFSSAIYTAMPSTISFNPLIFIGTIIFAVLTILISCRKPAKFAGNITPVEALNYTGIKGERTKSYHSDDGGKLHKMAYRNIFREKKQSFVVILSLLIGIIALLATQSFLKSMDLSNYANSYFPDDLTLSINVTDNDDFKKTDENKAEASNKLLKDIEKIEDVTVFSGIQGNIDVVYDRETFMPFFQEGNDSYPDEASTADNLADVIEKENLFSVPVTGLDEEFIERYNEQAEKPIDIEKFRNGEICFIGDFINDTYRKEMIGKTITLKNTETGKTKTIGIGASLSINDYFFPDGSNWETVGVPQRVYVSKNVIEELSDRTWVKEIVVDCDKENEPSVRDLIKSLTQNNICIPSKAYVEIKSEMLEEFQSSILSMRILTAGISIVLMLIGIVNFINVMFVGLYARRNELAMMESIGMTKQQIYKMLVYEGLYYTGIITFFILTVGNLITYLSSKVAQKIADYAVFHYPYVLMIFLIAVIAMICVSVPVVAYQHVAKKSIVERLREE